MVEIALCLGVIGFAMIAILGVLPTGLKVQQENREETIINQDGMFLIEAIRGGPRNFEDLTNYVDLVTVTNFNTGTSSQFRPQSVLPATVLPDGTPLTRGGTLVGLLSTPKYESLQTQNILVRRGVTALVRSIAGTAMDRDSSNQELAFRYHLTSEIVPMRLLPSDVLNYNASGLPPEIKNQRYRDYLVVTNQAQNFYEVRLTLRWPVVRRGNEFVPGNNSKTFRTLVSGRLAALNPQSTIDRRLYRFTPSAYSQVSPPAAP